MPKDFEIGRLTEMEDELQVLINESQKFRSPGALLGEVEEPPPDANEGRTSLMRRKMVR